MKKPDEKQVLKILEHIEDKAKEIIRKAPTYDKAGDIFVDVLDIMVVIRDLRMDLGTLDEVPKAVAPEKAKKASGKQ